LLDLLVIKDFLADAEDCSSGSLSFDDRELFSLSSVLLDMFVIKDFELDSEDCSSGSLFFE
jgi:hypothetical protein